METSKLIASTMTFRESTLEHALTRLKANGFENVEICSVGDWVPHIDFLNLTAEQIRRIAAMIKRIGVHVVNINVGINGLDAPSNDIRGVGIATVNNMMRLAKAVGAEMVTIAADHLPEGVEMKDRLKAAANFNKIAADLAEIYGVTLAVEAPHKLTIAELEEQIADYWAIQDERVKCTLDDAHLTYAGVDLISTVEKYIDRIQHVQLRDAVKGNSLKKYGEGDVDFVAFIKKLKECGYDGYYSMEYPCDTEEEAEKRLKDSIAFFEKLDVEI